MKDKNLESIINYERDKFDFKCWLRIVNKTPTGIEEFGFSSSIANDFYCNALIHEAPLFQLFLNKIKQDLRSVFSRLEDNQMNLADIMGQSFYKNDPPPPPKLSCKKGLLRKLGIEIAPQLTTREVDIIKLLLQGYSAGKIAPQTFLSRRTVEHNIERLKMKLLCNSKTELIQKAQELDHLGYLLY